MEITTIGQTDMYLSLATRSSVTPSNVNTQKGDDFEKEINKVFVKQLTNVLFSGNLFGATSGEYSHLMKDAMSNLLAEQFNIINFADIGGKYDK